MDDDLELLLCVGCATDSVRFSGTARSLFTTDGEELNLIHGRCIHCRSEGWYKLTQAAVDSIIDRKERRRAAQRAMAEVAGG